MPKANAPPRILGALLHILRFFQKSNTIPILLITYYSLLKEREK
jgi:hypothetical protein